MHLKNGFVQLAPGLFYFLRPVKVILVRNVKGSFYKFLPKKIDAALVLAA